MFAAPPSRASLREVFRSDREVYFSLNYFNSTSVPQVCEADNTLIYAPFADAPANSIRIAIARFKVPTTEIPVTRFPWPEYAGLGFQFMGVAWGSSPTSTYFTLGGQYQYLLENNFLGHFPSEIRTTDTLIHMITIIIRLTYTNFVNVGPECPVFIVSGDQGVKTVVPKEITDEADYLVTSKDLADLLGFPQRSSSKLPADQVMLAASSCVEDLTIPSLLINTPVVSFTHPTCRSRACPVERFFVSSTGLAVDGNREGANSSRPVITDVLPDPDSFDLGSSFIYEPNFLRWYTITQGPPYERINIAINYQDRVGNEYPVMCGPGKSWSALVVFRRGEQD